MALPTKIRARKNFPQSKCFHYFVEASCYIIRTSSLLSNIHQLVVNKNAIEEEEQRQECEAEGRRRAQEVRGEEESGGSQQQQGMPDFRCSGWNMTNEDVFFDEDIKIAAAEKEAEKEAMKAADAEK